jgi:hypothetical protein
MLAAIALLAVAAAVAMAQVIVEPDNFAPGTDISTATLGLTLSTVSSNHGDPSVFAVPPLLPAWASTGALVFGHVDPFKEHWVTDTTPEFQYGALRADFDTPAPRVEIDVIGNDIFGDFGVLRAYDAAGALLAEVQSAHLGNGESARLIADGVGEIAYVIAGGLGTDTVGLDRLYFVPEPGSLTLMAIATLGMARRRSGCA